MATLQQRLSKAGSRKKKLIITRFINTHDMVADQHRTSVPAEEVEDGLNCPYLKRSHHLTPFAM